MTQNTNATDCIEYAQGVFHTCHPQYTGQTIGVEGEDVTAKESPSLDEDSILHAIETGMNRKCSICDKYGAGMDCAGTDCGHAFHLPCAVRMNLSLFEYKVRCLRSSGVYRQSSFMPLIILPLCCVQSLASEKKGGKLVLTHHPSKPPFTN